MSVSDGPVNYCVDSIRSPFEVEALRASSAFTLLGVDAPARVLTSVARASLIVITVGADPL